MQKSMKLIKVNRESIGGHYLVVKRRYFSTDSVLADESCAELLLLRRIKKPEWSRTRCCCRAPESSSFVIVGKVLPSD